MRAARLFIKGLKDPMELTEKEGEQINVILKDDTVKNSQRVVVAGTPIPKGEMRYVMFYKLDEKKSEVQFDEKDLLDMQTQLEPYFLKREDEEYTRLYKRLVEDVQAVKEPSFYTWPVLERLKALRAKRDGNMESIEMQVEDIMEKHFIGHLFQSGEQRFLKDKKAIVVYDDGSEAMVQLKDGSLPGVSILRQLDAWKVMKARKEYGRVQELKQLQELAGSMGVPEFPEDEEE